MKIAHLLHFDGPGGGSEAVLNLVRGFRDSGVDQVVFHGGSGRLAAGCETWGVPHIRLPVDRKSMLALGFIGLVRALRRSRPDVLLLQGQWAGPLGTIAAAWAGVKSIYITQWPSFYTDWTPFRAWRNAWAEWIPCRLACRVIALTPSVYYQYLYRGWAGDAKLVLLPNVFRQSVVPSAADVARIRQEQGWSSDLLHVVSVGRLADQKRVDWLLKAWPEVQRHCPLARLWIIGDGPQRALLEEMAGRLGITGSCTFLGAHPRGIEFMSASDIVVMTSLYESCAFVPLEAKACGRPLIANDVDGVRDNVRDGVDGFLVPPNDPAAFARRLMELLADPALRRRMGEAGRAAMDQTDSRAIIAHYRELIEEVLLPTKRSS